MMTSFKILVLFSLVLSGGLSHAEMTPGGTAPGVALARPVPPPQPPDTNPHPPETQLDKKRVAFGLLAAQVLLTPPQSDAVIDGKINLQNQDLRFHLDEACLKKSECLTASKDLSVYLKSMSKTTLNPFKGFLHPHLIPWALQQFNQTKTQSVSEGLSRGYSPPQFSDPNDNIRTAVSVPTEPSPTKQQRDEFIVHMYAYNSNGLWYHIDVIVSEDSGGVLRFERFFIMPIPGPHQPMPFGVSC